MFRSSCADYDATRSYYQQSLDLRREIQDRRGIIHFDCSVWAMSREQRSHYDEALALCQQALALCVEYHLDVDILAGIQAVAELLIAQNRPRPALKLLAFVRAQREYEDPHDQDLDRQAGSDHTAQRLRVGARIGRGAGTGRHSGENQRRGFEFLEYCYGANV